MATAYRVIRNVYRDSVSMMLLSATLRDRPGVEQASATMATPANLDMLREAGMLAADPDAGTSDLLVVIKGATNAALEAALEAAEAEIRKPPQAATGGGLRAMAPASLADGARAARPTPISRSSRLRANTQPPRPARRCSSA